LSQQLIDTLALIVATLSLIAGAIAAYLTYQSLLPPKRLLRMGVLSVDRLLDAASGMTLSYGGQQLLEPRLLKYQLISKGRHDIPSGLFDRERPLTLTFNGLAIIADLTVNAGVTYSVTGNRVEIGPDLIPKRADVTFALLTNGALVGEPRIDHHLADTIIAELSGVAEAEERLRRLNYSALIALNGFLLAGAIYIGGRLASVALWQQ
jgi:hypothetical protein